MYANKTRNRIQLIILHLYKGGLISWLCKYVCYRLLLRLPDRLFAIDSNSDYSQGLGRFSRSSAGMRVRQSENEYLCAKSAGPGRPGLITASQQHIDDGAATKLGSSSDCVALVSFDHKFLR